MKANVFVCVRVEDVSSYGIYLVIMKVSVCVCVELEDVPSYVIW